MGSPRISDPLSPDAPASSLDHLWCRIGVSHYSFENLLGRVEVSTQFKVRHEGLAGVSSHDVLSPKCASAIEVSHKATLAFLPICGKIIISGGRVALYATARLDAVWAYGCDSNHKRSSFDGVNLRRDPLEVREATRVSVLTKAGPGVRFNEHLECDDGETVFRHTCKIGREGIVSKRRTSLTVPAESSDWLKMKNPACEAVRRGGGGGLGAGGRGTHYARRASATQG